MLAALLVIQLSAVQATEDSDSGNEALDEDAAWEALLAEPDPADLVAQVNDGDLAFVPAERAEGEHAHLNRIAITTDSLESGWVQLEQCHDNLDPVHAVQIVFREGGIRGLEIASSEQIGQAWIDGASVQLRDVGRDARVCLRAESQALRILGDGRYRLRNGPFMRRFLDGYYPMRVQLDVQYPETQLRLIGQSPESQPGFDVTRTAGALRIDATFEGRLITCLDFCSLETGDCDIPPPSCS
ncbi:hypothetical protein F2Q65_16885 [Thiohalocapsa marina]|uniref:Uncharacterized protein n=1 Tax=Thiohalocapsa marina TaxID=424902 RepID=A0A5M8FGV9_9GAMM|nr:hypothetical protein [Thiohalocapsa marina]KAA6182996.1 hypothetical protein F2Q65_16885 [Thiohalocapsa marina]